MPGRSPETFTYSALTVPMVGQHWRSRPPRDASDEQRLLAFAQRIGYQVRPRSTPQKKPLPRAIGWVVGMLTRRPFESVDPAGHVLDTWSSWEAAQQHIASAAFFALEAAQLAVTAAHCYGVPMRAPRTADSDWKIPVEARTMVLTGIDDSLAA